MALIVHTKFDHGDKVECEFKMYKPGTVQKGYIVAKQIYQSCDFKPDAYMISYCVEPAEMRGYEHGDTEWIPECHTSSNCIPRIFEKVR